jgi:hypothetical protein
VIALAVAILLLVGQLALMRVVPATGVPAYMLTVGILELLENAGFRTLTGSPDGWPVPTDLGLTIAAVGWILLYFVLAARFLRVSRRS